MVLVTSLAAWIWLFKMVKTPRPADWGAAATRMQSIRFTSESVPKPVGGRMAPVTTTGLLLLIVRFRK